MCIRDRPTIMKTAQRELRDYISEISEHSDVRTGSPLPLGIQENGGGVNFAIFSRYGSRVRLELFDHPEDAAPARVIDLDSTRNRTGDVWHCLLYTSDAADDLTRVDLGGRRIIKK